MRLSPGGAAQAAPSGALVGLLALAFFFQVCVAARRASLTWDEPTFIVSGYSYLQTRDFRMNPEAPPLLQVLAALPLFALDLHGPDYTDRLWQDAEQVLFARRFLEANQERVREIAFWARLPTWVLGALLVALIGLWGGRLYGPGGGVAAAALAAVEPNLLAHGQLATTDFGCSLLMLAAVVALWWAVERPGVARWLLCGAVTALALASKYTAALLVPMFLVIGLCELAAKRITARSLLLGTAVVAGAVLAIVPLAYGRFFEIRTYLAGASQVYLRTNPTYLNYFMGEVSPSPRWYYHLAAFAIKTPTPTLLVLATALLLPLRRSGHFRTRPAIYLLVPAAIMVGVSCFDMANIGLRRILPAYPFLLLYSGQAWDAGFSRRGKAALAALLLWSAVAAAVIFPHHLSYFNELAGGPRRGPLLLDDSNLDWGQDLPALADWQRSNPGPLALLYSGNDLPEAYGIRARPMTREEIAAPQPGTYAVSAHHLVYFRKKGWARGLDFDWLTRYKPVARAGYSIYIYRFP